MRATWQWCCVGAASLWACGGDGAKTSDTQADTGGADSAEVAADTGADSAATETSVSETADSAETQELLAVVINEVAPAGTPDDWIELYNAGATTVDLSGWILRDEDPAHGYTFPAGTLLPAGVYLAVGRGIDGFDFGLGASDAVLLYKADQTLVDQTAWTDVDLPRGADWGRLPNGSGPFKLLWKPTRGAANVDNEAQVCGDGTIEPPEICDQAAFGGQTCAHWGWGGGNLTCADACTRIDQAACTPHAAALVINEVTSANDDAIELFNGTAAPVALEGYAIADDNGHSYTFPKASIDAGGYLVLHKPTDHTFGLGSADAIELHAKDGTVLDRAEWPSTEADVSFCRQPNGTGGFRACSTATFGATNDL